MTIVQITLDEGMTRPKAGAVVDIEGESYYVLHRVGEDSIMAEPYSRERHLPPIIIDEDERWPVDDHEYQFNLPAPHTAHYHITTNRPFQVTEEERRRAEISRVHMLDMGYAFYQASQIWERTPQTATEALVEPDRAVRIQQRLDELRYYERLNTTPNAGAFADTFRREVAELQEDYEQNRIERQRRRLHRQFMEWDNRR